MDVTLICVRINITAIQKSTRMHSSQEHCCTDGFHAVGFLLRFASFFFLAIRQSVSGMALFSRGFAVFRSASLSTNHIASPLSQRGRIIEDAEKYNNTQLIIVSDIEVFRKYVDIFDSF